MELVIRPVSVRALPNYRIHISYSDGAEGPVDLSDLVGRGIFEAWKDPQFFAAVHLGSARQIQWSEEVELDPDSVYLKLTRRTPEELFPRLKPEDSHARG